MPLKHRKVSWGSGLPLIWIVLQGCQTNLPLLTHPTAHALPRRPRLAIEPLETVLSRASDLPSPPAPEEPKPITAPSLDFHAVVSDQAQERLMQQWQQTIRPIQEQTEALQQERLRRFCVSVRNELRRRHVPVVHGEAEMLAHVKLTELAFDSLKGSTFEAEAVMGEWKTTVRGNSLKALSRQLAERIRDRYWTFENISPVLR